MTENNQTRGKIIRLRVSPEENEAIRGRAQQSGLPLSEFVRQACMSGKITISQLDERKPLHSEAAFELRRIGAMLKGMYPKDGNFSAAEKRKWWSSISAILGAANRVDGADS